MVDTILSSTTRLVANRDAWADEWKRRKIEDLALLLQGALEARSKVGLKMNLHKSRLESVRPAVHILAAHTIVRVGQCVAALPSSVEEEVRKVSMMKPPTLHRSRMGSVRPAVQKQAECVPAG